MRSRLKTAALALVLFAANWYIVRELFTTEYLDQMGSIEGAYIALARYITENWRDLTWFPLWYNGVPFQNAYPPLLHLIVAASAKLFSISPALAYHAVIATFYCLGPVTLFWMAWRLSGSRLYSFAAALLYSVYSPAPLLIPQMRIEMGGLFYPRRFQTLVQFGEGPHVASMTLLPLAIVLLSLALEKRKPGWYLLSGLSLAAVVLTNWLGAFALAAAVLAYLLSRQAANGGKAWATALGIGLYAYLIALPWIPPSTLAAVRTNAQRLGGPFTVTLQHLKYLGLVLVALAVLEFWFERWKPEPFLRFALIFGFIMGMVTLSSAWFGAYMLPQPERYHLEMEMGLILAGVFAARPLIEKMRGRQRGFVAAGLLLFCWFQLKTCRGFAKYMDRRLDIRRTVEYKTAKWMEADLRGNRVFAPGSISFWMNVFSDTPQFGGGFEQGITNPLVPAAMYQIYSGEGAGAREGEVAALWLKAYGVQAVLTGGPQGGEFYKPFRNARKFEDRFNALWREGDDTVYQVPQRSASLAHVVEPGDLAPRTPAGGLDIEPLRHYTAALDNPALPFAEFQWLNRHQARIVADLSRDQLMSVQVSYHPGWHARVNRQPRRTWGDRLGLLAIAPECQGRCTVELTYDGGWEMRIARVLSWLALLVGIGWTLAVARGAGPRPA